MSDWRQISQALVGRVDDLAGRILDIRRYLHQHPEASGEEYQTSAYLADLFEEAGMDFRLGPDGRGVVVDSHPSSSGPLVAFRADIDALRLNDEKTVSYRSREANLMHACGHDAHTAMAVGACLALSACRDYLNREIGWRCIFQPSEETASGALEMMEAGALKGVRKIIALHVDPMLPTGQIGFKQGALTACCEEFEMIIEGKGGHGARPHTTVDPVPVAAQLVQAVYALVPRSIDAREPAVVSFGVIQGGINPNVIPSSVQLRGTIRTFSPEVSREIKRRMRELSDGIAQATQTRIHFSIAYSLPAVTNVEDILSEARRVLEPVLGTTALITLERPSMGGEDFAHYLKEVPGAMLRLGVGSPLRPVHHLHSPHFDINEGALPIGAKALALTTAALLERVAEQH